MNRPTATVSLGAAAPLRPIGRLDYVDTFSVLLSGASDTPVEDLVKRGLEDACLPVRGVIQLAWRGPLRFALVDANADGQIAGWRITASEPDAIQIETGSALMNAALVARRDERGMYVSTFLRWNRRRAAPAVWAVVSPVHRQVGRMILNRVARSEGI